MFSDTDEETYGELLREVEDNRATEHPESKLSLEETQELSPVKSDKRTECSPKIARCISPDSITDSDTDDSAAPKSSKFYEGANSDHPNPIFQRLPNFHYEGRCKDEFEKLHEILSFSPWRRRTEQSRKLMSDGNQAITKSSRNDEVIDSFANKPEQLLLSPSKWAFADDCSDYDHSSPSGESKELCQGDNEELAVNNMMEDSTSNNLSVNMDNSATGSEHTDEVKDEDTHMCNGESDNKEVDCQSISDEEADGCGNRVTEEDEFSYAANVRVQNPHFTHRICFINEDEVNSFNSDEVNERELNESLRFLVNNYNSPSFTRNVSSNKRMDRDYNGRHSNLSPSSAEGETNNSNNSLSSIESNNNNYVTPGDEEDSKASVSTSQSVPAFSSGKGSNSSDTTVVTTPVGVAKQKYSSVVTATSRMFSNYFKPVRLQRNGNNQQRNNKREDKHEMMEEERTELNIQLACEFLKRQQQLETEAKFALGQAKSMAKMQVQLESDECRSLDIIQQVLGDPIPMLKCPEEEERREYTKQVLSSVDFSALENVRDKLNAAIATTNVELMELLVVKDSLRTQQEDLLAEIEDFTRHAQNQLHELQLVKVASKGQMATATQ